MGTNVECVVMGVDAVRNRMQDDIVRSLIGSELWLYVLGHISERNLKILSERNMLCRYVAEELYISSTLT